jgi:hypothetical protein
MSLTGMTVRRVRKLVAWAFAITVLVLLLAGATFIAFTATGTPLPEFTVML